MVKIVKWYKDQHEKISDLEFEMIELISEENQSGFSDKLESLKSLYKRHVGFEETELFLLVEDKIPKDILDHLRDEHGKTYELLEKLESLVEKESGPLKTMETISKLRGIHSSHIHIENEYFHPVLDKLNSKKGDEIMNRYRKKSFEDYVPMSKRD